MSTDEPQDLTEQERTEDAPETSEELSDEALESVSGGYADFKNPRSPFDDVG